ncbi:U-box domain-containing protein 35 [Dorcoceras hygrometricum]|uniref:U-box domain-containing protein 35 n=1 Tax=Dorcoceras hygrometricum TaxID=472368 RepID=A0A2Z7C1D8_9LAMI|nr:U-box domain-containing protein 35 [Dorcoceras hygrometricum]
MKRRRAKESADVLALMTSSVTSSYSADGFREQSQEPTAIAKRCRLHKLIRQRFALALKTQQMLFAMKKISRTAFSVDELSGCASLGQMPSFHFRCALSKKMMNSRIICPADGSQYKDSAVGLAFMESAVGLAMETSKVESAVRNEAEAKLNQLEHNKPAGTMTTSCKR